MPKGLDELRRQHRFVAEKIDADPFIPQRRRTRFYAEVDAWDSDTSTLEEHISRCCRAQTLSGPTVPLKEGEALGHARHRTALTRAFHTQKPIGSALPAFTPSSAGIYLGVVLTESDEAKAMSKFQRYFGKLRLSASRDSNGSKTRIFAYRNPESPHRPFDVNSCKDLFLRLAIPNADPAEYVMLAYRPNTRQAVRSPTCFDAATVDNLSLFQPGGVTAGGLPEVVSIPPSCKQITLVPRKIG